MWIKPGGECDGTSNSSAPRYDFWCSSACSSSRIVVRCLLPDARQECQPIFVRKLLLLDTIQYECLLQHMDKRDSFIKIQFHKQYVKNKLDKHTKYQMSLTCQQVYFMSAERYRINGVTKEIRMFFSLIMVEVPLHRFWRSVSIHQSRCSASLLELTSCCF